MMGNRGINVKDFDEYRVSIKVITLCLIVDR